MLRMKHLKHITESFNSNYLPPDMVSAGMIAEFSPYVGEIGTAHVIDIIQIKDITHDIFKKLQNFSESKWLTHPFEMIHAEHQPSEYIANENETFNNLDQFLQFNGFDTTLTYDDYLVKAKSEYDIRGNDASLSSMYLKEIIPYKTVEDSYFFRVPVSEAYKKSNNLKNTNKKTGIFEAVVLERKSWHTDQEVLDAKDVAPGMIGYDLYNGIYVEIIQCFKIDDLTENIFKQLQKKSFSKWLTYKFDIRSNASGTMDWFEADINQKFANLSDFMYNNSFENELSYDDYLMVVKTTKDIQGNTDYNNNHDIMTFYEVLPYNDKWLEVDAKEGWKKSKNLISTNNKTGIIE